ncbi:tRNA guanosine(34) transglycosylase Tgt, partial [Arthrospira platensis SPKY2]
DWAGRARRSHRRGDQSLFGIVQGGVDPKRRAISAGAIVELEFDGYGIGGLSVGEPREQMLPALAAALVELPADRPRYLMGVGDPISLVEAVALGVDQFDCVMQTRLGRHGTALTSLGRRQVKAARFAGSEEPVDPDCDCEVCARHSLGYIRHLLQVNEPTAARLL